MNLIQYVGSNVQPLNSKDKIIICDEFETAMNRINSICAQHDFKFIVTSSKRNSIVVPGAIYKPAKMSNHLVGHAVDGNLLHIPTGEYYNSGKMADGTGRDQLLIYAIQMSGVRWMGKVDSVHFDDALNITNPEHWKELNLLYNSK